MDEEEFVRKPNSLKRAYDRTFYVWITVISVGLFAQAFRSSDMGHERETIIGTSMVGHKRGDANCSGRRCGTCCHLGAVTRDFI